MVHANGLRVMVLASYGNVMELTLKGPYFFTENSVEYTLEDIVFKYRNVEGGFDWEIISERCFSFDEIQVTADYTRLKYDILKDQDFQTEAYKAIKEHYEENYNTPLF